VVKTRNRSRAHLYLRVAANEKGAFGSPSTNLHLGGKGEKKLDFRVNNDTDAYNNILNRIIIVYLATNILQLGWGGGLSKGLSVKYFSCSHLVISWMLLQRQNG